MNARLPPLNALRVFEATARLGPTSDIGTLTVSAPLLCGGVAGTTTEQFSAAHPGTELENVVSKALADFTRQPIDLAIRQDLGNYPGLVAERLFEVELIPVAAPTMLAGEDAPDAATLHAWPLLHEAKRRDWTRWFQAQGESKSRTSRGLSFTRLEPSSGGGVVGTGRGASACNDGGASSR